MASGKIRSAHLAPSVGMMSTMTMNSTARIASRVIANCGNDCSGFTEWKKYTYYVRRFDRVWLITGYDVKNLGAE